MSDIPPGSGPPGSGPPGSGPPGSGPPSSGPPGSGPPFGSNPPSGPSGVGGESTSGHSLIGVALGIFLFVLPSLVFAVVFGVLEAAMGASAAPILIGFTMAIVVPLGLFLVLDRNLKDGTAKQQAMRNAMRILFFVGVGTYALGGILVGACIALLASAY